MTFHASDRFMRVLNGLPVDRTPAWLMRQAGRYLPEYRDVRSHVKDFIALCQNPELACEVTLQPLRRYPLDAAILFQDILTLPHAMGAPLQFKEGEGPVFEEPIRSMKQVEQLCVPDMDAAMRFVAEEIKLITHELGGRLPLIGFCGSPWTVATYLVEGQTSKQFSVIRKMMIQEPKLVHALLEKLALSSVYYLQYQIEHGAEAVMIFDTWGGILPYQDYFDFSLNYMKHVVAALKLIPSCQDVPVIMFTKQGAPWYEAMASSGAHAIGVDWTMCLSDVRKRVGPECVLQGNLDPFVLYGSNEHIEHQVKLLLDDAGSEGKHIFNLGHGMMPDMDPDKVHVLLESLHRHSPSYHLSNTGIKA